MATNAARFGGEGLPLPSEPEVSADLFCGETPRLCRNVMHRRRPRPMRSELPAQLRVIAAAPNAFAA